MRGLTVSRRAYALLLLLCYPAWFRRRYGARVATLFADRCAAAARTHGARGILREWPAAIRDALSNGLMLRLRPDQPLIGGHAADPGAPSTLRPDSRSPGAHYMLMQDLRFSWKLLRSAPGVAIVALSTLAIGIAATIAMFTIVNGVVLRPLPFPDSHRVVQFLGDGGAAGWALSYPTYADLVEQSEAFESSAAWQGWSATLVDEAGIPRIYPGASVSGDFFEVLGVEPVHGRFFAGDEKELGHDPVVVIGHGLWQERFGGRDDVLGEPLFDDGSFRIVGVAPPGFIDPVGRGIWGSRPQIWRSRPDSFSSTSARDWLGFWAIGRLADGVSLEQADQRVREIGARLAGELAEVDDGDVAGLATLKDFAVRDAGSTAVLLLGAVGMLLLIACANVANLLLSRGTARSREIAIRGALGATRARLVRQLMIESLAMAVVATALGLGAAALLVPELLELAGSALPRAEAVAIDRTVVGFAALAATLTALLFGTAPALALSDQSSSRALREGGRGSSAAGRAVLLRKGFVVAQTAIAVALLVGAGLLAKSLWQLNAVDLGLDTDGVVAARVVFGTGRYPTLAEQHAVVERVADGLRQLPGVEGIGVISNRPMSGTFDSTAATRDDLPPPEREDTVRPLVRAVDPGFFATMGVPIVRGRGFTPGDRDPGVQVAVIDQEAARLLFGDEDPIGGRVTVRGDSREIVGVAGNVRNFGPAGDLLPVFYQPVAQTHQSWILSSVTFMVRSASRSADLGEMVRGAVNRVDPLAPVASLAWMDAVVGREVAEPRFRATLVLLFAGAATLLATVGLASVIAFSVSAQRRELAVRLALGAPPERVFGQVLAQAAWLAGAGVVAGMAAAWALARVVASMLFEVAPTDPAVFLLVPLVLVLVSVAAAAVPAARVTRIDPASVLRAS